MQPIVAFLKLDEDCFSSDSEERLALKMPSIDNKSLLADGTAPASHTSRVPKWEGACNSRHPVALVIPFSCRHNSPAASSRLAHVLRASLLPPAAVLLAVQEH